MQWIKREAKRKWARNHPDSVRESNRLYRAGNPDRVRRQSAKRMRRMRAKWKRQDEAVRERGLAAA